MTDPVWRGRLVTPRARRAEGQAGDTGAGGLQPGRPRAGPSSVRLLDRIGRFASYAAQIVERAGVVAGLAAVVFRPFRLFGG